MKVLPVKDFVSQIIAMKNAASGRLRVRIAGLDVGTKRIGVSISDHNWQGIYPLGSLNRKSVPHRMHRDCLSHFAKNLNALIADYNVQGLVIGLPLTPEGQMTPLSYEIIKWAKLLPLTDNLSANEDNRMVCTFWDERNSTIVARRVMHGVTSKPSFHKQNKDSFAAMMILDDFLCSQYQDT